MKNQPIIRQRGFTLMELMVAMAITTIIVTVLVSVTSIAAETWNRSRSELRASRMGKMMLDYMARDFESLVARRGNSNEWLSVIDAPVSGSSTLDSTSASRLVFFTAATDRYDGNVGIPQLDNGGDICCVAYLLDYKRPIQVGSSDFRTFVFNRKLVDPDKTFTQLLGESSVNKPLDSVFTGFYPVENISNSGNYICENIYQFTTSFLVQVTDASTTPPATRNVRVPIGVNGARSFRVLGTSILTDYTGQDKDLVPSGRLMAVEVSATVLTDFGMNQIQAGRRAFSTAKEKSDFLAKNSYNFTKMIQLSAP